MSISSIGGSQAAASFTPALTSVATGSVQGALTANVDVAASGVSSALQDLSSALGSIIDTTA
jgi:hypothetical protein